MAATEVRKCRDLSTSRLRRCGRDDGVMWRLKNSRRELLDEIDDTQDAFDGRAGDDAVTEVEDVSGTAGGLREDFFDAGFEDCIGREEGDGIEVTLHGGGVADGAPAFVKRNAPVEADDVCAEFAEGGQ